MHRTTSGLGAAVRGAVLHAPAARRSVDPHPHPLSHLFQSTAPATPSGSASSTDHSGVLAALGFVPGISQ